MKTFIALIALALLAVATTFGVGMALAAEPATSYGACVSTSTGYLRVLEKTNLSKSQFGKCRKGEAKITLPSVTGLAPSKLVRKWPATGVTETCTKPSVTGSTLTYSSCVTVTASPSAPPSPVASPTP